MKIVFSEKEIELILDLYLKKGKSILSISSIYKVSHSVIKRVLKENKIEIRDNNFYKSKKINEDFFENIDTEAKAYILGFIYADGCISNGTVSIKQKTSDEDILVKIKKELESEHKIIHYIENSGFSKNCFVSMISFTNPKITKDLHKYGVVENKSKILKFPNSIPNDLIPHFIRGYFDGDGSVYIHQKNNTIGIGFVGTQEFLEKILFYLKECCHTDSKIYQYKNKDIFGLNIGGKNKIEQIFNYLYNDSSIYLQRKFLIFQKYFSKPLDKH